MALIDPSRISLGQEIRFKSRSDHDNVLWSGKVTGTYLYDQAQLMEDILPYYREVAKRVQDIPPIETLHFFSLKFMENGERSVVRLFATEYVDASSLVINDIYSDLKFIVYGTPATEVTTILQLLRTHGYRCQRIVE